MAPKVFKIPDGNGGITYQIQTPDGQWHETDESGNPIPKAGGQTDRAADQDPVAPNNPSIQKDKRRRRPTTPSKDGDHVNVSIRFPKEEYKEFSDYIHWRCLFRESCTKTSFLLRLGLEAVRKDREYREFKKKNQ